MLLKKIPWNPGKKPLPLVTSGALRLFFVGIGSAFSKLHNQTNLLVIKGNDHLLIDCGTKCPQALWELGHRATSIKNLLITHSHADHIGGLEEFALLGRYFAKKKPVLIITEEYKKLLWEMSLKGGIAFGEIKDGRYLEFPDVFETNTPIPFENLGRDAWQAECGTIRLTLFRTKHIPDSAVSWKDSFFSLGVIIDDRILFTSDTRFDPELVIETDRRYHFEVIFHDCEFFTGGVHASLFELNELPPELKKKMYLTHLSDNFKEFRKKVKQFGFAGLGQQNVFYQF
jgi:ribonuclease BN (tRNA processing enzyme)